MSFVRTVLGDIPVGDLGIVYAHEHIVIQGDFVEDNFPEFMLDDRDKICREILGLQHLGVRTMVDSMPIDAGRSGSELAKIAQLTGMHIIAATGLHLRLYYPSSHWYDSIDEGALTALMVREINVAMEDDGLVGSSKAGVIKVAGSLNKLSDLERRNFSAAARAQVATGCPILTHTEQGTAALEQIQVLQDAGADLSHVVLSHLDRNPDIGYQREVLSTGVRLEYDSSFRWKGSQNHTLDFLLQLAPEFPSSFVMGMDAAKSAYWSSYGGKPGLSYLVSQFGPMLRNRGLDQELLDKILVRNPADAYCFHHPIEPGQKA